MKKILFLTLSAFVLAGCNGATDSGVTVVKDASVLRSTDSGATFEAKASVDGQEALSGVDILSWEFHPTNSHIIYIGTLKNGMYKTINQGDTWEKVYFPPTKAYGLAVDPANGDRIYASGVYQNVSKLYLSENAGTDWKEIYTEPGSGSVIIALAINPHNTSHILAANSNGVVIESLDRGTTWKNVTTFKEPVTQLAFFKNAPQVVLALVKGEDIVVSRDNGLTWPTRQAGTLPSVRYQPSDQNNDVPEEEAAPVEPAEQNIVVIDHSTPGVLYTGTNEGLYRSRDYGVTWESMDILASSKEFPIRAVAVNPRNSQEIVYTAGSAFYRSLDGGISWSTTKLDITRPVQILQFDPGNPNTLYLGLKKP